MSWFPKQWKNSKDKGHYYETLAEQYLAKQGLVPKDKNYHCRYGEIDLIMQEDNTLVFIEVKFRSNSQFGGALSALGHTKMQRLQRSIAYYVQQNGLQNHLLRIDFVAIQGEDPAQFQWIKNIQ